MRPRVVARSLSMLLLVPAVAACSGGGGDAPRASTRDDDCSRAVDRFEDLRLDALRRDPALAQIPGGAEEHERQTREVFTTSLGARCTEHPELARCLLASTTYDQASSCR